jgi:two-component system, LuxR family, response regulator FixJ
MSTSPQSGSTDKLIVIIDDDSAVLDSLRFALLAEGFATRVFPNGRELLGEIPPPVAGCYIVDQNMPGMSGLDLIAELRGRNIVAPAILITTGPSASLRKRATDAGVPIVEKPFLDLTLMNNVKSLLSACGRTP